MVGRRRSWPWSKGCLPEGEIRFGPGGGQSRTTRRTRRGRCWRWQGCPWRGCAWGLPSPSGPSGGSPRSDCGRWARSWRWRKQTSAAVPAAVWLRCSSAGRNPTTLRAWAVSKPWPHPLRRRKRSVCWERAPTMGAARTGQTRLHDAAVSERWAVSGPVWWDWQASWPRRSGAGWWWSWGAGLAGGTAAGRVRRAGAGTRRRCRWRRGDRGESGWACRGRRPGGCVCSRVWGLKIGMGGGRNSLRRAHSSSASENPAWSGSSERRLREPGGGAEVCGWQTTVRWGLSVQRRQLRWWWC